MDPLQNNSGKKQRNQRNKRNVQEKTRETQDFFKPEPVVSDKVSDPQPQRANRRQRNGPVINATTETSQSITETSPSVVKEKKEVPENVVIDHSNLKRETEEITKLTKKFTRREITSNWHRYSAPEGSVDTGQTEEDAPADFSELLQLPASSGGHLQLKEEQAWSKASGAELSGYFALDLKVLGLSLACIPIYKQLRLPEHMLTEEELKGFDAEANQAKKCYNPNKIEDPNQIVLKTLTNLVKNEPETVVARLNTDIKSKDVPSLNSDEDNKVPFSIFNIEGTTQKDLNIVGESNKALNEVTLTLSNINDSDSCLIKTVDYNYDQYLTTEETHEIPEISEVVITFNEQKPSKLETVDRSRDDLPEKSEKENTQEKEIIVSQTENKLESENSLENLNTRPVDKNKDDIITGTLSKKEQEYSVRDRLESKTNTSNTTKSEEKRTKKNNQKEYQTKETSKRQSPITEANIKKTQDKTKEMILEDDDDLDFLLSLKKPVPSQIKQESKPDIIKDSSFLPGGTVVTQPKNQETQSELDNWLDSVLQD